MQILDLMLIIPSAQKVIEQLGIKPGTTVYIKALITTEEGGGGVVISLYI